MPARKRRIAVPQTTPASYHPDDDIGPGSIVQACIHAAKEGKTLGKWRPAVVVFVAEPPKAWKVMGITTKATHADGKPRVPIQDWMQAGLAVPSYFWGGGIISLSHEAIEAQTSYRALSLDDALALATLLHQGQYFTRDYCNRFER